MDTQQESAARVNAALQYAVRGWRTIPLHSIRPDGQCTCGRSDCASPAKHPKLRAWPQHATVDPDVIRRWWLWWPTANLGVATGGGLVVLDVDGDTGAESLRALEQAHGGLDTPRSITARGSHYLFYVEGPMRNATGIRPGLDIRADGGFIVAPPSLHPSGKRYAWDLTAHPDETPLMPAPRWLLALCAESRARPAGTAGAELRLVQGDRNDRLFRLACAWRRQGIGAAALRAMVAAVSAHHAVPPLPRSELDRIAASAAKYPPGGEDDGTTDELLARALGVTA
jgi:hypothetical protein